MLFFLIPSSSLSAFTSISRWSFLVSLADRAIDLLMEKNVTFTFHRLFKLTSPVCVWCFSVPRLNLQSQHHFSYSGRWKPIHNWPSSSSSAVEKKVDLISKAGSETFDGCHHLPGYQQIMHRTASPSSLTCNTHSCLSYHPATENILLSLLPTILQGN